jgi:hypothetical protein
MIVFIAFYRIDCLKGAASRSGRRVALAREVWQSLSQPEVKYAGTKLSDSNPFSGFYVRAHDTLSCGSPNAAARLLAAAEAP